MMGIDKQGKLAILAAQRGPLEHELFAAEIELETKTIAVEHASTGVTQEMVEACKERVEGIRAQIKAIDDRKEKVNLEGDE
jgi:hypothetical protein